jgi:hypothetical protein
MAMIAMWEFKWSYVSILDGMDWYQDDSYECDYYSRKKSHKRYISVDDNSNDIGI